MKKLASAIIVCYLFFTSTTVVFAELPPQVVFDMNMKNLANHLKAEDYTAAAKVFSKTDSLLKNNKLTVDHGYWYYRAETMANTGGTKRAYDSIERYFNLTGTTGRFYDQSLILLSGITEKLEQEERNRAEKEQKENKERAKKAKKLAKDKALVDEYMPLFLDVKERASNFLKKVKNGEIKFERIIYQKKPVRDGSLYISHDFETNSEGLIIKVTTKWYEWDRFSTKSYRPAGDYNGYASVINGHNYFGYVNVGKRGVCVGAVENVRGEGCCVYLSYIGEENKKVLDEYFASMIISGNQKGNVSPGSTIIPYNGYSTYIKRYIKGVNEGKLYFKPYKDKLGVIMPGQ